MVSTDLQCVEDEIPSNPEPEGEYVFWDCPDCGERFCTWTDCPGCGWYDEMAWNLAVGEYLEDECGHEIEAEDGGVETVTGVVVETYSYPSSDGDYIGLPRGVRVGNQLESGTYKLVRVAESAEETVENS